MHYGLDQFATERQCYTVPFNAVLDLRNWTENEDHLWKKIEGKNNFMLMRFRNLTRHVFPTACPLLPQGLMTLGKLEDTIRRMIGHLGWYFPLTSVPEEIRRFIPQYEEIQKASEGPGSNHLFWPRHRGVLVVPPGKAEDMTGMTELEQAAGRAERRRVPAASPMPGKTYKEGSIYDPPEEEELIRELGSSLSASKRSSRDGDGDPFFVPEGPARVRSYIFVNCLDHFTVVVAGFGRGKNGTQEITVEMDRVLELLEDAVAQAGEEFAQMEAYSMLGGMLTADVSKAGHAFDTRELSDEEALQLRLLRAGDPDPADRKSRGIPRGTLVSRIEPSSSKQSQYEGSSSRPSGLRGSASSPEGSDDDELYDASSRLSNLLPKNSK